MAATFTHAGEIVLTARASGQVEEWRLDQLKRNHKPVLQANLKGRIGPARFSADGTHLLIPRPLSAESLESAAYLVNLDDPATFEDRPSARGALEESVGAVAFSADGELVAAGDHLGTVRIWKAKGPHEQQRSLRGHEGPVHAAAFSPHGELIATAGSDGTVRLWRLGQPMAISPEERASLIPQDAQSPRPLDPSSSSWTMHLRELTRLARETAGRNFTTEEWLQLFPGEKCRPTFEELPACQ
jgi:WD40 repeat protein